MTRKGVHRAGASCLGVALALSVVLAGLASGQALAAPGFAEDLPAAYLRGHLSARAAGMGGVFTTVGDSPIAALYNPAELGGLRGFQLEGMHVVYEPMQLNVIGLSLGSLGVNLVRLDGGTIPGYDEWGNPTGDVGDNEQTIAAGIGLGGGFLRLGAIVKYMTQQITFPGGEAEAKALGADAGVLLTLGGRFFNVRLGVDARDLPLRFLAEAGAGEHELTGLLGGEEPKGTVMVWSEGENVYAEQIPTRLRVGLSAEFLLLTLALDVDHLNPEDMENSNVVAHMGAQVNLGNVKLRAGAYTDPTPWSKLTQAAGEEAGQRALLESVHPSAGIGIAFTDNIVLDYALEDSPVGLKHYLTANFRLGG